MGILTACTSEIKANLTKFEVSVCGDYEEWRLRGYDAVWPCINWLTCRRKVLYPYHTPETSVNFYHIARRHVTADFNIKNLWVVFIWTLVNFMTAVNYTNAVNWNVSPSCRVATLVSGTGSRVLWTMYLFPWIQAIFHRQFVANCVHFSELSCWLYRNNSLMLI